MSPRVWNRAAFFYALPLIIILPVFSACEDGASASDGGTEPWSCEGEEVWEDPANGLCWMLDNALLVLPDGDDTHYMDWWDADRVCSRLEWGGYSDWRLPMIQDLISIIRGCPSMNCPVEDPNCLESECNDTPDCAWCELYEGPGEDGCYWPTEMGDDCVGNHWTQSELDSYSEVVWVVDNWKAQISTWNKNAHKGLARCVRSD